MRFYSKNHRWMPTSSVVNYKSIILPLLSCLLILISMESVGREVVFFSLTPLAYSAFRGFGCMVFFFSGLFINIVFQEHYRFALVDYLGVLHGSFFYVILLVFMALPYCLIPWFFRYGIGSTSISRTNISIVLLVLIWVGTDYVLPSKYWIGLAECPWALWLVRQGGEWLLVISIGCMSALLIYAVMLRNLMLRLIYGLSFFLLLALTCVSCPDFLSSPRWLPGSIVGVQFGATSSRDSLMAKTKDAGELYKLVTSYYSVSSNTAKGWLGVMPELTSAPLIGDEQSISFYKILSDKLSASFVINGIVMADDEKNLYRATRVISSDGSSSRVIKKSALVPIFETLNNDNGVRYIEGKDYGKTVDSPWGKIQSLLCFELFDRTYTEKNGESPSLVVVEADTTKFRHPVVDRHLLHVAMFKSQVIRSPVIIANYTGPSFIAWPNGEGYQITKKNESAAYVIDSDGNVEVTPMLWEVKL